MKMRALAWLVPGGVAAGLATALVDAAVKGGVLFLIAAGTAVALRNASAATRHFVWTVAIACALGMPLLSVCLPQWRVLPGWIAPELPSRELRSRTAVHGPLPAAPGAQMELPVQSQDATSIAAPQVDSTTSDPRSPAFVSVAPQPIRSENSRSALLLIGWAFGAALMLLPLMRSAWSLHRFSRRAPPVRDGVLPQMVDELANELRLRRSLTIHAGSANAMPMVWGIRQPHLLLPSSAEHWSATRLRAVLLHELAHIRRRDSLTLLLAQLARAVHWFNPLAWLAVHRLRVEQERACDDEVLRAGVKPSDYATDVLEIATALHVTPASHAMALSMASPARLERRLRLIVEAAANRAALTGWVVAAATIAAIAIALPLAMLRAAEPKSEVSTTNASRPGPQPRLSVSSVIRSELVRPRREFTRISMVLSSNGKSRFLNLTDGKTYSSRPAQSATAYIAHDADTGWHLKVEDAFNYHTDRERGMKLWESMTAEEAAEPAGFAGIPPERHGWYPLRASDLPITIQVPGYGLLQVAAIEDPEEPSIVLEYKRVEMTAPAARDAARKEQQARVSRSEARTPDTGTTERTATLAATRAVVDEWLAHIAAGRTEPMWALTTREQGGLSLDVSQAWAFPSIRAKYVLGNDHAAMVVSTRYEDNAGRTRVLLCTLVKRDGRWLIQEHLYGNPDDIQLRVAGFAAYPGVQYDVRTEDLVGQWKTFFFTHSTLHTFRTDGSGETQERKGEYRGKTTPFRWEVVGNVLRRHVADQSYEGTVVRLDDEQFSVRHGNGEVGYVREPEPRATRP